MSGKWTYCTLKYTNYKHYMMSGNLCYTIPTNRDYMVMMSVNLCSTLATNRDYMMSSNLCSTIATYIDYMMSGNLYYNTNTVHCIMP